MKTYFKSILILLLILYPLFIFAKTTNSGTSSTQKKEKQSDSSILKRLYGLLFVTKEDTGKEIVFRKSDTKFRKYQNKRVRKIYIKQKDVFQDPNKRNNLKLIGNQIHIDTRVAIIRKNLLFKEFSLVDAKIFSASEKRLSELDYIKEATIEVVPIKGEKDFVDVVVNTRDKFSKEVNIGISKFGVKYDIGFKDKNLLGLGNTFDSKMKINKSITSTMGNSSKYKISNIDGSFIDAELFYLYDYRNENIGGELSRNYEAGLKYVGAIKIRNEKEFQMEIDDTIVTPKNESVIFDFWIGRVYSFYKDFFKYDKLFLAVRHSETDYISKPSGVAEDSLQEYKDIIFNNLFKVVFAKQNFYRTNYIYGFGENEYLPYGKMVEFIFGLEKNEFYNRFYYGFALTTGDLIEKMGFFYNKLGFGFYTNDKKLENNVLRYDMLYLSSLKKINNHYLRWIAKYKYVTSLSEIDDEKDKLAINNSDVRGFDYNRNGEQKLSFSSEVTDYTPWKFLGFNFSFFGFYDFSVLNEYEDFFAGGRYNSAVGLGLRLKNNNLVFNTIQLRFVYFPLVNSGEASNSFDIFEENNGNNNFFDFDMPEIIKYE